MLDVNRLRVIDAVARHGSVTAAAKELHYSQPSVTHHLARLEAETGAQLLQRVGRGIRLTPAGQLLADRAAEIIGRIDAAGAELSAHVGLNAGRVRLAGFASANGSLVPAALATLADRHPGLEISLTDTHPLDALELLRTGKVEVAIIFRYDETEPEPPGVRLHHLLDDPVYVLSTRRERGLATLRDATWIAGCERCRSHLLSLCADAGFDPRIGYSSDDMVVMQAWVAAGLGVATQTGLALRAHHIDGVVATELPGSKRHIYAATYGEPPDPPATAALLAALAEAATSAADQPRPAAAGYRRSSAQATNAPPPEHAGDRGEDALRLRRLGRLLLGDRALLERALEHLLGPGELERQHGEADRDHEEGRAGQDEHRRSRRAAA